MASPQKEKGFTGVAHEILHEIAKMSLNGTQFRIILMVWRFSYGFSEKKTIRSLSIAYLSKLLGASKGQVDRELKKLINLNIITVIGFDDKGARILSFQKNYKEWGDKGPMSKPVPEIPKKKQITNKNKKYHEDNTYYKMAKYFYKRVEKVAKDAGISHLLKKSNMQSWADDMRKLIEIDEVNKKLAKEVMDWVTQNDFWKTNILSANKLRKQFPQLAIKMSAEKKPSQPKQLPDSRDKEIELQQWIAEGNDPDEFNWNG